MILLIFPDILFVSGLFLNVLANQGEQLKFFKSLATVVESKFVKRRLLHRSWDKHVFFFNEVDLRAELLETGFLGKTGEFSLSIIYLIEIKFNLLKTHLAFLGISAASQLYLFIT